MLGTSGSSMVDTSITAATVTPSISDASVQNQNSRNVTTLAIGGQVQSEPSIVQENIAPSIVDRVVAESSALATIEGAVATSTNENGTCTLDKYPRNGVVPDSQQPNPTIVSN